MVACKENRAVEVASGTDGATNLGCPERPELEADGCFLAWTFQEQVAVLLRRLWQPRLVIARQLHAKRDPRHNRAASERGAGEE